MKPKMQFISRKNRLFRRPLKYYFSNRNVKDRLFCYIFEHDRKALLELYNALNQTDYHDEQALQIITLDNVVYMSMNNDLAFLLIGTMNLYEHQSTFCPNLPLRFLLYIAAEYENLVMTAGANIYGRTLVPLPAPQCVVFYNGDDTIDDELYLNLSDAFADEQGQKPPSNLELTVRILNINSGHNSQLTAGCRRLDEYSRFVSCIKEYSQYGLSTDEAIDEAVVYCINHGIMADILLPLRAEVKKMLLTEYNERKYRKMFRKEAQEEGRAEGLAEGRAEGIQLRNRLINVMLQNGLSAEQIAIQTGLPLSEIKEAHQKKQ